MEEGTHSIKCSTINIKIMIVKFLNYAFGAYFVTYFDYDDFMSDNNFLPISHSYSLFIQ